MFIVRTMTNVLEYLDSNEPQFRKSRLPALYSDFRHLRKTNPDGFIANVTAWLRSLAHAARAGALPSPDRLSLSLNPELLHAFETENGRPLALGAVIQEGITRGELLQLQDFKKTQQNIYHRGSWAIQPWDILTWSLRRLGISTAGEDDDYYSMGKVVIVENLEIAGKEAHKRFGELKSRSEKVFTRKDFAEKFQNILGFSANLSESDMELFLKFLARDKGFISYNSEIVKLRSASEADLITMEDTTIASLKSLIQDLDAKIFYLTERLASLEAAAKEAVTKKNREAAIAALRSKKGLIKTLNERQGTLLQLENVLASIEKAADQIDLVKVMEASSRVLANLSKEAGGVEKVEDVVGRLQQEMSLVDEITTSTGLGFNDIIPDIEVDEELEFMEKEEKEKATKDRAEREQKEAAETKQRLDELNNAEISAKDDRTTQNKGLEEISNEQSTSIAAVEKTISE
ncbi:unnamed protein product [Blumeria hordei]|uniref:SNF7 family protein n=1 Tax=Blumeria hordei TaxID=2867405 RepID=A0A383UZJ6_BLUHO|nr:unnamed protein product [Blumeria hordei]